MYNIFSNWNVMRFVRLLLGVSIIAQGLRLSQWSFIAAGVVFTLMPLFNIGCCAGGSCSAPSGKGQQKSLDDVIYEEVKGE